jgi:hypothetical protein
MTVERVNLKEARKEGKGGESTLSRREREPTNGETLRSLIKRTFTRNALWYIYRLAYFAGLWKAKGRNAQNQRQVSRPGRRHGSRFSGTHLNLDESGVNIREPPPRTQEDIFGILRTDGMKWNKDTVEVDSGKHFPQLGLYNQIGESCYIRPIFDGKLFRLRFWEHTNDSRSNGHDFRLSLFDKAREIGVRLPVRE